MTSWLSDASANRHIKTYVKDFLDVSGNLTVRNQKEDYAWNAYGQVLSGPYESDSAYLGVGVGMDVSGLTIVVGGHSMNVTTNSDGAVSVYRYDTTAKIWYQLGDTVTSGISGSGFGHNVDINDAGTRFMTIAYNNDFVNVYDYNSSTNAWDEQVSITAHGVGPYGGRISGDGNTIIFNDYQNNSNTGKQYVYRNTSGTTWTKIGEFTGAHTNSYAGLGVTISYDGNRITLGESNYNYDADGNYSDNNGRVIIYDYSGSGTTWNQVGNALFGNNSQNLFGGATDFSKDGSIVACGSYRGYVEVYQYDASVDTWNQLGTTIQETSRFGFCVRLSDDGTVLLVADSGNDTVGTDNGALYIYKYTNGDWVQQGSTLYSQYTGARLGYDHNNAISISGDGTKIVAGGLSADVNGTNSGYVQAWQWSQKYNTNPALDISGGTVTMWGDVKDSANNYSVSQLGADIDEEGGNSRSNTLHFSSDGTTLYIGHQLGYNEYGERTGTFRVMRYRSGEWYRIGSMIAPRESEVGVFPGTHGDNTYYNGGGLSSDGTRALGSWRNGDSDASTARKGLMRVYDLSGGDWVQVGGDIEGDSAGDLISQGRISGDGNTISYASTVSNYTKILTYNSSTNTWDLQTTISSNTPLIVGLSYDGTIRIDRYTTTSGDYKVIAYKYANGSWSQIGQELKSYEVANDEVYNLVDLSKYGDYLLVGDQDSFSGKGVALVYKYNSEGDIWMQLGGNIQNPFSTEIYFTTSGGISADGKTIVVTDYLSRGPNTISNAGAFAVYKYFDGNWTQIHLYEHAAGNEQMGSGANMCDNGELFAVSAPSGTGYYARTYQITNNPTFKIENGNVNMGNVDISQNCIIHGNIGIGTSSPDTALHVHGDGTLILQSDDLQAGVIEGYDNHHAIYFNSGYDGTTNVLDFYEFGDIRFWTGGSIASQSQRMHIDKQGNIGIGTSSPNGALHIYEATGTAPGTLTGTLVLDHGDSNGISSITFPSRKNNGSDYGYITYQDDKFNSSTNERAVLTIGTSNDGDDDLVLSPSGNVGVKEVNPGYTIEINGDLYVEDEARFANNNGYWVMWRIGTSGSSGATVYFRTDDGGDDCTLRTNGWSISDDRIKTNEEFITNATETLMKLSPQKYNKHRSFDLSGNYKEESGLIAQDIWYNAPELRHIVRLTDDSSGNTIQPLPLPDGVNTTHDIQNDPDYNALGWGDEHIGVKYGQLIPYLIKSNQEQEGELNTIESQITDLLTRVSAIESA